MKRVDEGFWLNVKQWTLLELFFLLREQEPVLIDCMSKNEIAAIREDLTNWKIWAKDYPGTNHDHNFLETKHPARDLLIWAESLYGVEVPKIWHLLYKDVTESKTSDDSPSLGDKEHKNLLVTIGALALALKEATGRNTAVGDKPNISGLSRLCQNQTGEIHGMSIKSLNKRISEGIKLMEQRK